ncbi:tRNA-queuosine alpha-mannosyltransferase domain-containing protein [Desulfotalea psychrophila]|uniref:tRNA-queuosine alpha-mannosyltransferase n=1 Tax=Desulfotalea psychrophila (strain LSv54 / DSM 12343) TaxID=177439 RepID=Q6AK70_DESPS|nr:DUF3524 domain-containing protein [Desulfotalea psychrophila]CAG37256.1 conserved hypothetical protein [Desulfotalea psychrophila LSv54]
MKKILILEPYYGGSHKQFLDKIEGVVEADCLFMTLPARKWKMRMQLSAPWFVQSLGELLPEERFFDTVLCSTFVDVAVLRALVSSLKGWNPATLFCTYFHENQFVYPNQEAAPDNRQFTAINFTTALASDRIAFNSVFNRQSFLESCRRYLSYASDMKLPRLLVELEEKSCVLYPGLDFTSIDAISLSPVPEAGAPVIVWNHRWEHDKNPEEFFAALTQLQSRGIAFRLIVLGQSFRNSPACFAQAEVAFREEMIHFGYAESYEAYAQLLQRADIVVSTAIHEFYGVAVIEAVRAGCVPLLPRRLSYPELFAEEYLYDEGQLTNRLQSLLDEGGKVGSQQAVAMTEGFSWTSLADAYRQWLLAE